MSSYEYFMQTTARERLQARRAEAAAHRQVAQANKSPEQARDNSGRRWQPLVAIAGWLSALRLAARRGQQPA